MTSPRRIVLAKTSSIVGFLALLSTTYYLRSEVLELSRIRFSADDARARHELERMKQAYPERLERLRVETKNYELQLEHYKEMLELYQKDYDAYAQRLKDKYQPPQLPVRPQPPDAPDFQETLAQINADFRARRYHYFRVTGALNGVAWAAAMALVGGLLYLLLFDLEGQRWLYGVLLVLSFVFLIGPSFHSILSAIIGFLAAPSAF